MGKFAKLCHNIPLQRKAKNLQGIIFYTASCSVQVVRKDHGGQQNGLVEAPSERRAEGEGAGSAMFPFRASGGVRDCCELSNWRPGWIPNSYCLFIFYEENLERWKSQIRVFRGDRGGVRWAHAWALQLRHNLESIVSGSRIAGNVFLTAVTVTAVSILTRLS